MTSTDKKAAANITVNFGGGGAEIKYIINVGLDEEANQIPPTSPDEEPSSKSQFEIGEPAYVRITSSHDYTVHSSIDGSYRRVGRNIPNEEEQIFQIALQKTQPLPDFFVPTTPLDYEWIGKDAGSVGVRNNPETGDRELTFSESIVGILKIKGTSYGDRWEFISNKAGDALVVGVQTAKAPDSEDFAKASSTVKFVDPNAAVQYRVKVVNHCTKDPVAEAYCRFGGGRWDGYTNAEGYFYLGEVRPGTYSIDEITKSGYIPVREDRLANEAFTLPKVTEDE